MSLGHPAGQTRGLRSTGRCHRDFLLFTMRKLTEKGCRDTGRTGVFQKFYVMFLVCLVCSLWIRHNLDMIATQTHPKNLMCRDNEWQKHILPTLVITYLKISLWNIFPKLHTSKITFHLGNFRFQILRITYFYCVGQSCWLLELMLQMYNCITSKFVSKCVLGILITIRSEITSQCVFEYAM